MFELSTDVGNLKELREGDFSAYDALYLGDFSCPDYPNNFSSHPELLEAGLEIVKSRGQKAYLRLYAVPGNDDLGWVEDLIDTALELPFDALEVHNLGVLRMLNEKNCRLPVHLGVFGNLYTHETAKVLKNYGVTRVYPNPELSLAEVRYIAEHADVEVLVPVHGKIPLVISETCFILEHSGDGEEEGGQCGDGSCSYQCTQEHWLKRGRGDGSRADWSLKDTGRMTLSGKDLCMLEHATTLAGMGLAHFYVHNKGEAPGYAAAVGSIYREALTRAFAGAPGADPASALVTLTALAREGLCNGYYFEGAGQRYIGRA
ncbi:MAG TPA: peptidase U32 family protein [Aromatoleum sp.]|uniref:peptidase U32 family protein n=1 Tax=Aromatoleum sp. TaxID=2307007 RepID=UPI002B49F94D|nr:peptidase U32 family protein [Aromatoleum sp.]HJV24330.1 peptidase U32 family protein [Aromatoleum sp.]